MIFELHETTSGVMALVVDPTLAADGCAYDLKYMLSACFPDDIFYVACYGQYENCVVCAGPMSQFG